MSQYSIYTLSNPSNHEIFYVGCTGNLKVRGRFHTYRIVKRYAKSGQPLMAKDVYILQLMQDPIIHVIDVLETDTEARARENFWIALMIDLGFPLTNKRKRSFSQTAGVVSIMEFINDMASVGVFKPNKIAA